MTAGDLLIALIAFLALAFAIILDWDFWTSDWRK